jgi:hypothetical protein
MLLDYSDTREGFERMWKCISCGREIFENGARQREDDRVLAQIKAASFGD